jgi:hypothetical protein
MHATGRSTSFFFKKKRNDSSSAFQLKDKREAEEALS